MTMIKKTARTSSTSFHIWPFLPHFMHNPVDLDSNRNTLKPIGLHSAVWIFIVTIMIMCCFVLYYTAIMAPGLLVWERERREREEGGETGGCEGRPQEKQVLKEKKEKTRSSSKRKHSNEKLLNLYTFPIYAALNVKELFVQKPWRTDWLIDA